MFDNYYTIIIPTRGEGSSYDIFKNYALPLYKKHIYDVKEFIVICPIKNLDSVKNDLSDFGIKVLSDEEILEEAVNVWNWHKQQIIKLKAAKFIKTKHYLILDDDMLITKDLYYKDFFNQEGQIFYGFESWPTDTHSFQQNVNWLLASCNIMNVDINYLKQQVNIMGVTPQLMITQTVLDLLTYLGENLNLAISQGATEFLLYWCFLIKNDITNLYSPDNKFFSMDYSIQVLHKVSDDDFRQIVKNAFITKKNYFIVIQSWLNYSYELTSSTIESSIL